MSSKSLLLNNLQVITVYGLSYAKLALLLYGGTALATGQGELHYLKQILFDFLMFTRIDNIRSSISTTYLQPLCSWLGTVLISVRVVLMVYQSASSSPLWHRSVTLLIPTLFPQEKSTTHLYI